MRMECQKKKWGAKEPRTYEMKTFVYFEKETKREGVKGKRNSCEG